MNLDPNGSTIGMVDPARPDSMTVLVDRPADAPDGDLSPDGRFLVCQVSAGGGWQIRVLELETGRQWTAADGFTPTWSADGATILYQTASAVRLLTVSTAGGFVGGADVTVGPSMPPVCCDIANRTRILALAPVIPDVKATVVVNWPALLREDR